MYKNKRYLKHKRNRKHKDNSKKETKIQNGKKRSGETEKQKGNRLASVNENLTQYSTPNKKSKRGSQPHSAEDHKKNSNNRKRTHAPTDTQEPIQDKLFKIITNKVITMMKVRGGRALDELTGSNKGKIRLLSRADEKK
jgi:hypothetical protein